ncbi:hypothetical protein OG607_41150 [Streptomyces sp. NBC_01537]|uniref:hypothetical protein n=1 Tax=Streptomyces sp. NBC_01537 TaxID=2903896 RepID=UPI00386D7D4D
MTDSTPYPVRLARDISRQIDQLSEHLAQAKPQQAAQIIVQVLDAEDGIIARLTALVTTGSHFAKDHARTGTFPPQMWLVLGRAANDLHDLCLDLDEHADDFGLLTDTPITAVTGPAPSATAKASAAVQRALDRRDNGGIPTPVTPAPASSVAPRGRR